MSRIRSVHPGFFTDENLVCVSMAARLLFIGLGVEADDKGIFEWKPLTIKMRIFPADNIAVDELLAELVEADKVMKYEVGGRHYGAIRNFCKFQRPKKPNDIHPITELAAAYTGHGSEPVGNQFRTSGEKSPQMEEGGGSSSSVSNETDAVPVAVNSDKEFWETSKTYLGKAKAAKIGQWVRDFGKEPTAQAITAAQLERAVEPIAYIERTLRNGKSRASPEMSSPC